MRFYQQGAHLCALLLACSVATTGLFCSSNTHTASAAPTESRGTAETEALTEAQKQYDAAKQKLQAIGSKLEQTDYELNQTESELKQLDIDITDTQNGIDDKTRQLDSAQKVLSAYIEISYKSGQNSTLDLLLSATDFNDFVTRGYYTTKVQDAQINTINEIRKLKSELETERNTLTSQQEDEKKLKDRLTRQQQTLSEAEDNATQTVNSLSAEVKELFSAQQAELAAAAAAQTKAAVAAEAGAVIGVSAPSVSQGSIVANANASMGIPYVWAGDDDNFGEVGGFDCSGFVQHCYALEGYDIGRTTWDQIDQIKAAGNWKESVDELTPGDLVFPNDGHVGIYIGNNQMIDAPYPGMFVQVDDITDFIGGGSPV